MLTLRAPAKINWFLEVAGRRPDGYHDIVSLMQCVNLYDTLSFEPADRIELVSGMDLPAEQNLVYRAAVLLGERSGYRGGAKIRLHKEIPSAAGLGGGSSDAAATLLGLNLLWGLRLDRAALADIGAALGSDVPFFISGRYCLAEGRGERLTPLRPANRETLLLVKPAVSVSTAWAYSALPPKLTKNRIDIKLFCHSLARRDFTSLGELVLNDLEEPVTACYPVIAEIREQLLRSGALMAAMSGSGSTVFGVFESAGAAAAASMDGHWCRVVQTLVDDMPATGVDG